MKTPPNSPRETERIIGDGGWIQAGRNSWWTPRCKMSPQELKHFAFNYPIGAPGLQELWVLCKTHGNLHFYKGEMYMKKVDQDGTIMVCVKSWTWTTSARPIHISSRILQWIHVISLGWIWELVHPQISHGAQAVPSAAEDHTLFFLFYKAGQLLTFHIKQRWWRKGRRTGERKAILRKTPAFTCASWKPPPYSGPFLHVPRHPLPMGNPCLHLRHPPTYPDCHTRAPRLPLTIKHLGITAALKPQSIRHPNSTLLL